MRSLLIGGKADEPKLPPPEVLRKILTELGPFYVKIGQLLSTRPDLLPPEYIKSLTALQAQVPPIPWENIETIIRQELSQPITQVFNPIEPLGDTPIPTLLRTVLDFKSLSLQSPRHFELLLDRIGTETLQWNVNIQRLDYLRRSIDDSANRLSFSIVVGSLIIGSSIISTNAQNQQLSLITNILFAAASFLGLWLIVSILRSGRLK